MKSEAPLRVARYLRCSRAEQNVHLQDDETAELIERRGWLCTGTYIDEGISGTRDRRPQLDLLVADAKKRRFDAVVVWKSDRLFRSLKNMAITLDEWNAVGVGFVSATEVFDSTTPQGRLLMHLTSAFAEFERSVIVELTKAGLAAARRHGARIGRPRVRLDKRLHRRRQHPPQTKDVLGHLNEVIVSMLSMSRSAPASWS